MLECGHRANSVPPMLGIRPPEMHNCCAMLTIMPTLAVCALATSYRLVLSTQKTDHPSPSGYHPLPCHPLLRSAVSLPLALNLFLPSSHPPSQEEGRERYVFFAFPHIAIDESGELGAISRPNRPGKSCACGAMAKVREACFVCARITNVRAPGLLYFCSQCVDSQGCLVQC